MTQSFQLLQPIRTLTFNIFRVFLGGGTHLLEKAADGRSLVRGRSGSSAVSAPLPAVRLSPSPTHPRVMSGGVCPAVMKPALITGSWTVCGSRSVIILQPGGRAEITPSTSANAMQLPDLQPCPSHYSYPGVQTPAHLSKYRY